ncbi:2-oxo acid dehydrogenase subunit E2 [Nocardioides koreensis]|uniref:Dihydrolipoamide acetyltransferase component of pyruvate dehydrogenase complex n=1 Tax=Nocardioides koreensis TaxID=433651 RepID=A0ABP5L419_9ACTN
MSDRTFLLPDLGEGLTEAEIVRWLVAEGDVVAVDQSIVEVETAKSIVEVPSPYAGRVATLHAGEGQTLDVGKPLITVAAVEAEAYREEEKAGSGNVLIGYGTAAGSGAGRRRRPRSVAPVAPVTGPAPISTASSTARVPRVISPLVRRLAQDNGVDLRTLDGTGLGGLIVRADVEAAIVDRTDRPATAVPTASTASTASTAPPAPPAPESAAPPVVGETRIPLNGFRRTVAEALSRSRAEIPEATVWVDVDATALWNLRESARTATSAGPGLMSYIARFVVAGLREHPVLNARLDTERQEIVAYDAVNLGLAVQTDRGLVVPAVLGAERMTTAGLDEAIRDLTARARAGRATTEELTAGTFTLNNYGSFNVDGSAAIINHPQVAILGLGRIIDRPWVVDGELCVRKITQMSFVFDHRICDGGTAAGFMRSVADAIENPASAIARL